MAHLQSNAYAHQKRCHFDLGKSESNMEARKTAGKWKTCLDRAEMNDFTRPSLSLTECESSNKVNPKLPIIHQLHTFSFRLGWAA